MSNDNQKNIVLTGAAAGVGFASALIILPIIITIIFVVVFCCACMLPIMVVSTTAPIIAPEEFQNIRN